MVVRLRSSGSQYGDSPTLEELLAQSRARLMAGSTPLGQSTRLNSDVNEPYVPSGVRGVMQGRAQRSTPSVNGLGVPQQSWPPSASTWPPQNMGLPSMDLSPSAPPSSSSNNNSTLGRGVLRLPVKHQKGVGDLGLKPEAPEEFSFDGGNLSLEDYIAQAQGLFSGTNSGIANRQAALESNRARAIGSNASATEALIAQLAASRAGLDARYTQGINEAATANQGAISNLAQMQDSSEAQNAEMYRNLGITVDTTQGNEDLAFSQGALAELGGARDTEQRAKQLSAYGLSTSNMDSSRMRGVENQAGYEQNYQEKLAALLDEQQNVQQNAINTGISLYGNAQSQANNNRDFAYQEWLRKNSWAREDAQAMLQNEGGTVDTSNMAPQELLMYQLEQAGTDPLVAQQYLGTAMNNTGNLSTNGARLFGETFAGADPQQQAALWQYLKNAGIVSGG